MNGRAEFRQALIQSLSDGLDGFDLARLRGQHEVSDDVARLAARDVFFSQCLQASQDWRISADERKVLARLGERLQLSDQQQAECVAGAKHRVFDRELKEALADEMISNVEANSLAHLRKTLGLAPMAVEEFGPPLMRPKPRRENLLERVPASEDRPTERSWEGPWGPRSGVLGIPYTVLVLSLGAGATIGGGFAIYTQNWWPLPAGLGVAVVVIAQLFLHNHCWHCGANWCLSYAGSDHDYSFFGGGTRYLHYECGECGAIKTYRRRRRYRY